MLLCIGTCRGCVCLHKIGAAKLVPCCGGARVKDWIFMCPTGVRLLLPRLGICCRLVGLYKTGAAKLVPCCGGVRVKD